MVSGNSALRASDSSVVPSTLYDPPSTPLPGIALHNGFRFRRGQAAFLHNLAAALRRGEENHLGVFVPGYGKTITALASFVIAHQLGKAQKLVVFVPRGNLRDQYADPKELSDVFRNLGAPPFSFCVADSERVFLKNLGTQIIITTYQYASGRGGHRALLRYCQRAPCMFVFDEVHHLSEDGLWAEKLGQFPFSCSVALSGTPMRSDNKTLFGVPFETGADGDQFYVALHEVTMRDAHEEGRILKRVQAHTVDYRLKLVREDTGEVVEMSLSGMAQFGESSKEVDTYLARRRLRFHDVYLESLLQPAFRRFSEKRIALAQAFAKKGERPPRTHQMLIIAMSNRHAAAILKFVQRRFPRVRATRIGQDLPGSTCAERLEQYRRGDIDVMVQVDMIGEGTDIKPISIVVKADLVRALSKTMQQVFRGMRHYRVWPESANVCDIYAANDSEVVATLEWITAEEQIGVKLKEKTTRNVPLPEKEQSEKSRWALTDVENHQMQTHSLELFPGYGQTAASLHLRSQPTSPEALHAVDINQQEKDLRAECAMLASELAFTLRGNGQPVAIRDIHARAKQRFSKAQGELSLDGLERKRQWLERCLSAQRLI